MPWGKPRKGGWSATGGEEPVARFSQVIRTVISLVPGGCIRYGKDGANDDFHTGFWLGVDAADNLAKFSIGSARWWFKWTGVEALFRGGFSTYTGRDGPGVVQWIGEDGQPVASLFADDGWGHWLTVDVPAGDGSGDPAMLDLQADGDLGAGVRVRLATEKGAGKSGTKVLVQVGNGDVFSIDGNGNVWAKGNLVAGGAVTADNVGGWSGTFRTDEINTVTVVGGRITAVA